MKIRDVNKDNIASVSEFFFLEFSHFYFVEMTRSGENNLKFITNKLITIHTISGLNWFEKIKEKNNVIFSVITPKNEQKFPQKFHVKKLLKTPI